MGRSRASARTPLCWPGLELSVGKCWAPTDAQPNAAQLEEMKQYVAGAMDDGAFGLSTGLYYAPQSYSKTEEVIELAKVAAAKGGVYDTHMRR